MSNIITLYTDESGYELFLLKKPFIASADQKIGDYIVTAPVGNVVDYPLEDELETYDVIKMNGVSVEPCADQQSILKVS